MCVCISTTWMVMPESFRFNWESLVTHSSLDFRMRPELHQKDGDDVPGHRAEPTAEQELPCRPHPLDRFYGQCDLPGLLAAVPPIVCYLPGRSKYPSIVIDCFAFNCGSVSIELNPLLLVVKRGHRRKTVTISIKGVLAG